MLCKAAKTYCVFLPCRLVAASQDLRAVGGLVVQKLHYPATQRRAGGKWRAFWRFWFFWFLPFWFFVAGVLAGGALRQGKAGGKARQRRLCGVWRAGGKFWRAACIGGNLRAACYLLGNLRLQFLAGGRRRFCNGGKVGGGVVWRPTA